MRYDILFSGVHNVLTHANHYLPDKNVEMLEVCVKSLEKCLEEFYSFNGETE